jgi:hypothetical protein
VTKYKGLSCLDIKGVETTSSPKTSLPLPKLILLGMLGSVPNGEKQWGRNFCSQRWKLFEKKKKDKIHPPNPMILVS